MKNTLTIGLFWLLGHISLDKYFSVLKLLTNRLYDYSFIRLYDYVYDQKMMSFDSL